MVVLPAPLGPSRPNTSPRATVKSTPRRRLLRAVGLAQPGDLDRGDAARHRSHHGNIAAARMLCGCIDIGTNTTRVLVAEARDGGLTEVLQRRAFTRLGRGLAPGGDDPGGPDRRDRERRRRAARAGRAGWRADDPRRRHGRHPPRRQPRRVLRRDPRARRRRGLRARRRGGGAAGLPGRHAHARPAAAGTGRGGRRRRRLDRDRGRHARPAASSGARRSRSAPASWPTPTSAATRRRASELDAVRAHAARALAAIDPGPVDIAVAVGGSAASLRRLVGDELDADSLARALRRAHAAARPRTSRSASTSTSSGCG